MSEETPETLETDDLLFDFSAIDASRYRKQMVSGEDIFNMPDPEPMIEGLLDLESMAFLFGSPGSYKSFMALDWALSVATGTPWNGHEVVKNNVLYVSGEGVSGIRQRVEAWLAHKTPGTNIPPPGFNVLKVAVPMGNVMDVMQIAKIAVEDGVKFVILDTLARCAAGMDENSSQDMGTVLMHADIIKGASGACVLFVHHSSKSDKMNLRGSSALEGAADSIYGMKKAGDGKVTLDNIKQKNHEQSHKAEFTVHQSKDSAVLVGMNSTSVLTEQQKDALARLTVVTMETGGPVKLAEWARACGVEKVSDAQWFRTAREKLVSKGFVIEEEKTFRVAA